MARRSGGSPILGYFILLLIALGLAAQYPQVAAVVVAAVAVGGWLWWRSRRAKPEIEITIKAGRPISIQRDRPSPVIDPADAIPPPVISGWPALPERAEVPAVEDVPVGEREYASSTCPACGHAFAPLPRAKKRCPGCGRDVYVRSGPDGGRHLLTTADLSAFDASWAEHDRVEELERQVAYEAGQVEWHRRLRKAGFLVGDESTDVVGESYRHRELAGLMNDLRTRPEEHEIHAVGELVREPTNTHDQNAVAVIVRGVHVGYVERWEAEEWQPLLRRMEKAGGRAFVHAVILGGRTQPDGMIGPIGVTLEDIPSPGE